MEDLQDKMDLADIQFSPFITDDYLRDNHYFLELEEKLKEGYFFKHDNRQGKLTEAEMKQRALKTKKKTPLNTKDGLAKQMEKYKKFKKRSKRIAKIMKKSLRA